MHFSPCSHYEDVSLEEKYFKVFGQFCGLIFFNNYEFIWIKSAVQYSCPDEVGALRDSLISQAFENSFFLLLLI